MNINFLDNRDLQTWLEYSDHASLRMAQRGITDQEIEYVCRHGKRVHRGGSVHFFLRKKDIPDPDCNDPRVLKLEGTTVLLDRETLSVVVTVYRNKSGLKQILRKKKYESRKLTQL